MTPEQKQAHREFSYALRHGFIVRPNLCAKCWAAKNIHGHHEDYSKPLDVVWLCSKCHRQRHSEIERASGIKRTRSRSRLPQSAFDGGRMQQDMAKRGWMIADLARKAGMTHKTVDKFLRGETQTNKAAFKLTNALGYAVRRYLIPSRQNVA